MKQLLAETIKFAMNNADRPSELHENYSGRGMYGKTTTGLVVNSVGEVLQTIIECAMLSEDDEPIFEIMDKINIDSFGLDTIIY